MGDTLRDRFLDYRYIDQQKLATTKETGSSIQQRSINSSNVTVIGKTAYLYIYSVKRMHG